MSGDRGKFPYCTSAKTIQVKSKLNSKDAITRVLVSTTTTTQNYAEETAEIFLSQTTVSSQSVLSAQNGDQLS